MTWVALWTLPPLWSARCHWRCVLQSLRLHHHPFRMHRCSVGWCLSSWLYTSLPLHSHTSTWYNLNCVLLKCWCLGNLSWCCDTRLVRFSSGKLVISFYVQFDINEDYRVKINEFLKSINTTVTFKKSDGYICQLNPVSCHQADYKNLLHQDVSNILRLY